MATIRFVPPTSGAASIKVSGGRSYSAATGGTVDVPDFDAPALEANGWISVAKSVGTTAQRPILLAIARGYFYHDTTLGVNIVWDGITWRSCDTGANA